MYTSKEQFRVETKIQSKFFKSLKLNEYRKSIAIRYGFKSIKLYEDSLEPEKNKKCLKQIIDLKKLKENKPKAGYYEIEIDIKTKKLKRFKMYYDKPKF
jgi:hypothetical protein